MILYMIWQCTWGFLQTLLGLFVFLTHAGNKHYLFHGAIVTEWEKRSSVSLGLFIFIADRPYRHLEKTYSAEELSERLLVHEYGHTIQSLLLGPLYLLIVGIPSASWANMSRFQKKRRRERISYFTFYTESWANRLGEKTTGRKSMETLVID